MNKNIFSFTPSLSVRRVLLSLPAGVMFLALLSCSSGEELLPPSDDSNSLPFAAENGSRPVRVAVMEFSGNPANTPYDRAVTDEVIRRLSHRKQIRLVERSRLQLLLKEQSLTESGIISREEVIRIGKIFPVDLLVSGTYSVRGDLLHIRGRFSDVVTGEIRNTFSFQMQSGKGRNTQASTPRERCDALQRPLLLALQSVDRPGGAESAAREAEKIPLAGECGRIHSRAMHSFRKGKHYPERYMLFLVRSLETMQEPEKHDFLVRDVFQYFSDDGTVSPDEWKGAKEILKRHWHPTHMKYFLRYESEPMETLFARLDDLMNLARRGEIGRPYALSQERVLTDIIRYPFLQNREEGIDLTLYLLENYGSFEPSRKHEKERLIAVRQLADCYFKTGSPGSRTRSLNLFLTLHPTRERSEPFVENFWSFLKKMEERADEGKGRTAFAKGIPTQQEVRRVNREMREWICAAREHYRGMYAERELLRYMSRHGVRCDAPAGEAAR